MSDSAEDRGTVHVPRTRGTEGCAEKVISAPGCRCESRAAGKRSCLPTSSAESRDTAHIQRARRTEGYAERVPASLAVDVRSGLPGNYPAQ